MTKHKKTSDSREVVIPQVELFSDHILLTCWKHTVTSSGIIINDNKGNILTEQQVVAAGPNAVVKVGDMVEINPNRFEVRHTPAKYDIGKDIPVIQVPIEIIDNVPYLFMSTRELKYKYKSK